MRRTILATSITLACARLAAVFGCDKGQAGEVPAPAGQPTAPAAREEALPPPRLEGTLSLEAALARRRSVRAFSAEDLSREQIGQLLWAAQGFTSEWGGRTAPSAGALYPLDVYVATRQGVHRYVPPSHLWISITADDRRRALHGATLGQSPVGSAPAVFVVVGVTARTASKYGDRAPRYVYLEAGHAAQNLLLEAVSLGLAAVPMGAFDDAAVQRALGLPADHAPLYLIPVGHPR